MNTPQQGTWNELQGFVASEIHRLSIPGAVVGVLHNGHALTAGFGVTNADHALDVNDETLFQIGSITKTFTATAIMRLAEQDRIDLDGKVRTYLPDFRVLDETATDQATVRHLLTHTGGWVGDVFHDTGPGPNALHAYVARMSNLEQLAPIGAVWSYNNAGFGVVGAIIEAVTGESYERAMQELVFEPLGLTHTFLNPADVMVHRFAVGHLARDEGAVVAQPWSLPRSVWPAGGITCSVHDLLHYAGFHMGNGNADQEPLLTSDSISQMQTPQATVWKDVAQGLSWRLETVNGLRLVSHGGGTLGQVTHLTLVPERGFAVAVFTNSEAGGAVTAAVTDWALKMYQEIERPKPQPVEASEDQLAAFVGSYLRPMIELELGMLGGRLTGQMTIKQGFPTSDSPPPPAPPPMTLGLCEDDRLIVLDGSAKGDTADVIRQADGSIGWLRFGGRIHRRE